jgi:hypothetical protein
MARITFENVCGYSCSSCGHFENERPGCEVTGGKPFWTAYVDTETCPIYDCCVNERKYPHCGKCPDLMCELTRFKDPDMTPEQARTFLVRMEKDLRSRT